MKVSLLLMLGLRGTAALAAEAMHSAADPAEGERIARQREQAQEQAQLQAQREAKQRRPD